MRKNYVIRVPVHELEAQGVGTAIGEVILSPEGNGTTITVLLRGVRLSDGEHGFHLHQKASLEVGPVNGVLALGGGAGGHYDPENTNSHRGPYRTGGHRGDLPKIKVVNGVVDQRLTAPFISLPEFSGRTLIIHSGSDNYSDTPKKNGGCAERYAGGIVIPPEWDKKVCPISGKMIARTNPAGKTGFCCKKHVDSWARAEQNPLLAWHNESGLSSSAVPGPLRPLFLSRAEQRYARAFEKVPFEVIMLLPGDSDRARRSYLGGLVQMSGGVSGMTYLVINSQSYRKFWENNGPESLEKSMKLARGSTGRESFFTPHTVMHRLGDEIIGSPDTFFSEETGLSQRFVNFYSATIEVMALRHAASTYRTAVRTVRRDRISPALDTAAGRMGAIVDGSNLFAEAFARFVISGRLVFHPKSSDSKLTLLAGTLKDLLAASVAALRSTSSVWDLTAQE